MADTFLHGVEVLEVDSGSRPIQTVRSSVIGLVGTAPNAALGILAALTLGATFTNNALVFTAVALGALGNGVTVSMVDPDEADAALSVAVVGRDITISLATDELGAITSTAASVLAAVTASAPAAALVTVANGAGSVGSGLSAPSAPAVLSGGTDSAFPLNTPRLVTGRHEVAKLGLTGTLPDALDSIFDQAGAVVVVVRVAEGETDAATMANVLGGVDPDTGDYTGVHALLAAESVLGVTPRILIAPGFTHQRDALANAVLAELVGIAERLRAIIVADGPNTTDADAIQATQNFGSARIYFVDPWVLKVDADGATYPAPISPCVAGVMAKSDNDRGFWWSPSNQPINGIVGTTRPVDFVLGDASSRANLLNEQNVATVIRQDGFRLWGNRTLSSDPKWSFLSVRRIADIINDSLLRAHLWAVDRNITRTYLEDVTEGVNAYLRQLVTLGAIAGGECWADPELNTPANLAAGKVYFNFAFSASTPAERLTFRSFMTNDYLAEIV